MLDLYHVPLKPTAVLAGLSQTAWCCFRSKWTTSLHRVSGTGKGQMSQPCPGLWGSCLGPSLQLPRGPPLRQTTPHPPWFSEICVYLRAHEQAIPAKQIFPEFLNHWRRLQKVRVAADVLVLSLQKQNGGRGRGTQGGRERRKEERTVKMAKRLTEVTVKKRGYTRREKKAERRLNVRFKRGNDVFGVVCVCVCVRVWCGGGLLGCSTDHPTAGSWPSVLLTASLLPLEPTLKETSPYV